MDVGEPVPQTRGSGISVGFEQRLKELESLLDELDRELWRHGFAPPRGVDGDAASSADVGGAGSGSQTPPTARRVVGTLLSAAAERALTLTATADRLSALERRQLAAILRLPGDERRAIAELLRLNTDEREQLAAMLALTDTECAALAWLFCEEAPGRIARPRLGKAASSEPRAKREKRPITRAR
jgi:hypothetical protein